jgi:hypothetical protein
MYGANPNRPAAEVQDRFDPLALRGTWHRFCVQRQAPRVRVQSNQCRISFPQQYG